MILRFGDELQPGRRKSPIVFHFLSVPTLSRHQSTLDPSAAIKRDPTLDPPACPLVGASPSPAYEGKQTKSVAALRASSVHVEKKKTLRVNVSPSENPVQLLTYSSAACRSRSKVWRRRLADPYIPVARSHFAFCSHLVTSPTSAP